MALALVVAGLAVGPAEPDGAPPGPGPARELAGLIEAGEYARAEEVLRLQLERGNEAPVVHRLLGVVLLRQYRVAEAETHLRVAVAGRPELALWRHDLARALLEQGRCRAALDELDLVVAASDRPEFRYDRAMCALNVGDVEAAIADLERVLQGDPDHRNARLALARARLDLGAAETAVGLFQQTVAEAPGLVAGWVGLGRANLELGRSAEAVEAFTRARALAPTLPEAVYGLGRALALAGRTEEAKAALADFAELSAREERVEAARQYVALQPTDLEARLRLARELLDLSRAEEALEVLRQALGLGDPPQELLVLLARAWEALGREEAAARVRRLVSGSAP